MSVERRIKIVTAVRVKMIRERPQESLSSKYQKSKTHVRDTGENCQPPEEDELSLYGGSDFDNQIDKLVDTPHIANANGGHINEDGEDSDENDFIKDIENDFNLVEQTGEPIGSNLVKITNSVIRTPINKENLLKSWKATPDMKI